MCKGSKHVERPKADNVKEPTFPGKTTSCKHDVRSGKAGKSQNQSEETHVERTQPSQTWRTTKIGMVTGRTQENPPPSPPNQRKRGLPRLDR